MSLCIFTTIKIYVVLPCNIKDSSKTMRLFNSFLFIILLFFVISCKNESKNDSSKSQESVPVKVEVKKKTKETTESLEKESDSINSENVIDFLIKYGELNKENKVLLKTRLGNITIKLYENTELHRSNFILLTEVS